MQKTKLSSSLILSEKEIIVGETNNVLLTPQKCVPIDTRYQPKHLHFALFLQAINVQNVSMESHGNNNFTRLIESIEKKEEQKNNW